VDKVSGKAGSGPVSTKISDMMDKSSWIRRMFEEGSRLKAELGPENVFDFTLGNPIAEPPEEVRARLQALVASPVTGSHRYMPNAGLADTREKIAAYLCGQTGLGFTAHHIVMTAGAGGALNVIIKSLCDPSDEVVILAPYFAEYMFYIDNHQAAAVVVQTDEKFQPVPSLLERAIGPRTRMVLLNSPNNPSGAVYPEKSLREIGGMLEGKSRETGRTIYLVMDEPYRKLTYNGANAPSVFRSYRSVISATSHSKDLNLPGERIGYIAVHPEIDGLSSIIDAMTLSNRILGFVNAPALFQRVVSGLQDVNCDMTGYSLNRATLVEGLGRIGYQVEPPGGGFYLFPKSPTEDDVRFVAELKKNNVLVVPGSGFGRAGHFRIAFCCENSMCHRALPGFEKAFMSVKQ